MMIENESCELSPNLIEWFEEVSSRPSSLNACRVRAGNSCGSGSFVGVHQGGALILSNAHVKGTRIGSESTFQFDPQVSKNILRGQIIMAAYSSRVTADWAISLIPGWVPNIKPAFCTRQRPTGQFYTTGSPSCVWPLRHQSGLSLLSNNNAGFAVWNQPAVPGQSGSGVWSMETHLQNLLLTWRTGNGNGAGQPLNYIWEQGRVAMETGALIGGALPSDAEPLSDINPDCEEGFFSELSIRTLPIWFEDQAPPTDPTDPEKPTDPPTGCPVPIQELIESYRKIRDESLSKITRLESSQDSTPINPPSGGRIFGLR